MNYTVCYTSDSGQRAGANSSSGFRRSCNLTCALLVAQSATCRVDLTLRRAGPYHLQPGGFRACAGDKGAEGYVGFGRCFRVVEALSRFDLCVTFWVLTLDAAEFRVRVCGGAQSLHPPSLNPKMLACRILQVSKQTQT